MGEFDFPWELGDNPYDEVDDDVWITAKGERIHVKDLDKNHLANIVKMLRRRTAVNDMMDGDYHNGGINQFLLDMHPVFRAIYDRISTMEGYSYVLDHPSDDELRAWAEMQLEAFQHPNMKLGWVPYRLVEMDNPPGYGISLFAGNRPLALHANTPTEAVQRMTKLLLDEGYEFAGLYRDDSVDITGRIVNPRRDDGRKGG